MAPPAAPLAAPAPVTAYAPPPYAVTGAGAASGAAYAPPPYAGSN